MSRSRHRQRGAAPWVSVLALGLVAVLALWLLLLRPPSLGGSTSYRVVPDDAMEPSFAENDLLIVRERDTYAVGDVVLVRVPPGFTNAGERVVRRIVGGTAAEGYEIRADDTTVSETWKPLAVDVIGRRSFRVANAGSVLRVRTAVIALVVIVWLYALTRLVRFARNRAATRATPASFLVHTPAVHRQIASGIRARYLTEADPAAKRAIRHVAYEIAMAYHGADPDFDKSAFLEACGIGAAESRAHAPAFQAGAQPKPRSAVD